MGYYLDDSKITLDALRQRILDTDLIPSRSVLKENIDENFSKLKSNCINTLDALRSALKNTKNIPLLAEKLGVDAEYLALLRREIESFFPKAFPIKKFDWLESDVITKLEECGYKNSKKLYEAFCDTGLDQMILELKINREVLSELSYLVNLTRIQWISPMAAKMLYLCGYTDIKKVAKADDDIMCDKMDSINKEKGFFKGRIGLRDIKRLIKAAEYLL